MTDGSPQNPPPGSNAAIKKGCTCPVLDNAHGKGYMGGAKDPETGETLFVMTLDCPLHGRVPAQPIVEGAND